MADVSEGTSHRAETGAALVEMALTLVLLVMLLVGVVTSAIALGRDNSLQNAAREASRFAATLPGPVDNTWLNTVRDVARAAASGDLDTGAPGVYICVAHLDGATVESMEQTGGGAPGYPDTECYSDGRPASEVRVQVLTRRESNINAILFSTDVTLQSEAAARYER